MAWTLARAAMLLVGAFFAVGAAVVRGWNVSPSVTDSYLIYASRDDSLIASLYVMDVDRNEHYPLDSNFDARSGFACSGNGENFAFMHDGQLHIISADGRHEVLDDLRGRRVHSLTVSNNGAAVVVSVYSMTSMSLGIVRVPEGGIRWLTSSFYGTAPHLSFDDRIILFNVTMNPGDPAREIYMMNVNSSNLRHLLTRASDAVWKPNDQTLAYVGHNRDLYLADLHRQLSVPVTRNARGSYNFYPAWSPDGGRIAYLAVRDNGSELRLHVTDANGKNTRELAVTGQLIDRGPCFLNFRPQTLVTSAS